RTHNLALGSRPTSRILPVASSINHFGSCRCLCCQGIDARRPIPPREVRTLHFGLGLTIFCARSRHSAISIPSPSTGSQRSPSLSNRFITVLIVNLAGSRPRFTSDHFSGAETVAPGYGRQQ